MSTTKPNVPKRKPSRKAESRDDELARLIQEQSQEQIREPVTRRSRSLPLDPERVAALPVDSEQVEGGSGSSDRLAGEALRLRVRDIARRTLQRKKLEVPPLLAARLKRQAQRDPVEREALRWHAEFERVRRDGAELARRHSPRDGRYALHALRVRVAELEANKPRLEFAAVFPEFAAIDRSIEVLTPPLARSRRRRPLELSEELARVARIARKPLSMHARIATELDGPEWTDRTRALVAIVLDCWPAGVSPEEPLDPREIIKLETESIHAARVRQSSGKAAKRRRRTTPNGTPKKRIR